MKPTDAKQFSDPERLSDAYRDLCDVALLGCSDSAAPVARLQRRLSAVEGRGVGPTRSLGAVRKTNDGRDDGGLLRALRRRDQTALRTVAARYGGALIGYAARHLHTTDPAAAESVVSDALLALWEKAEMLRHDSNIRAFLFKAVRDRVVDALRRGGRQLPQSGDADTERVPDDLADRDTLSQLLRRETWSQVLSVLDEHCDPLQQDVLLLTAWGSSDTEIGTNLRITPDWVRQLRKRGRTLLNDALKSRTAE